MNKSSAKIAVVSDSNKAERCFFLFVWWDFSLFSSALLRFFFQSGHALPPLGRSPVKVRVVRAYCKGFPA